MFVEVLKKGKPGRLSIEKQEKIYAFYQRTGASLDSSVRDEKVTKLARTILMGPHNQAYVCMDHEEEGDHLINEGSFKKVYHAVGLHDGGHYAVGKCDVKRTATNTGISSSSIKKVCEREKNICKTLYGLRGIVSTRLVAEIANTFFFVMDFYEGGDLFDLIDRMVTKNAFMPLGMRVNLGLELLAGLVAMHERGIYHRDLKLENVFLDKEGHGVLGDFGLAHRTGDSYYTDHTGTSDYYAPELIRGQIPGTKTDVWAFGMVFYTLVTLNHFPWQNTKNDFHLITQMIPQNPAWKPNFYKMEESLPPSQQVALEELISKMLRVNPAERIDSRDALARLQEILAPMRLEKTEMKQKH